VKSDSDGNSDYFYYSKSFATALGSINDAIYLQALLKLSKDADFNKKGFFEVKVKDIERLTGLTKNQRDVCRKRLCRRNVVFTYCVWGSVFYAFNDYALEQMKKHEKSGKGRYKRKHGYIYAIAVNNKIKIGRSIDPKKRFFTYKRFSGTDKIEVIRCREAFDYFKEEDKALKHFNLKQGSNEWMDYSEEVKKMVMDYFDKNLPIIEQTSFF
jgi:hypothetical protein